MALMVWLLLAPVEALAVPSQQADSPLPQTAPAAPPEQDDDALLQPLVSDDDFGVDWPDFEAPVLNDQEQATNAGAEEPSEAAASGTVAADAEGGAEDDAAIAAEIASDADITRDSGAIASEIAESISDDLADAEDSAEALRDAGRSFGNFRLVLRYADDTLPPRDREALAEKFDMLSALEQTASDDDNIAQIRRRADKDRDILEQLLRVYGHYDGVVSQSFEADPERDLAIIFTIQAGPQYNLANIDLGNLTDTGADYPFFIQRFGLEIGDAINSYTIVAARNTLAEALAENGYAFATLKEPELLIDHAGSIGDLSLPVEPGRKFVFGDIVVGDDPLLDADHIALIARFESGDIYRQSRIQDLRRAILATGLVSAVTIEPVETEAPPEIDSDDYSGPTPEPAEATVDLAVDIEPAPLRTIAGEVGFGTGEGFRVAASWEHRNLFPPEGLFRVRGIAGTQEQLLGATFRRNNFRERDQILLVNALVQNVQRDAFDARTLLLSGALQRQTNLIFQKKWTWSVGAELVLTDESDVVGALNPTGRRTFAIAALPLTLAYDGTDDLLDPLSGFRLSGFLSPEISFQSGTFGYERTQIDGSFYLPVRDQVTLAGRVRLGSIAGANALDIAPSRRFYAGGGGSVRGYGFQDVGPLDANGDPIGGRSLAEFSLEARIRFGNFGVVPFIDAGNVYNDALPTFGGLRYGAGLGFRYYSSFGPLRLDIGTPLNPRPGDAAIGVYVSLGQAF
ncbi:MAG: BamA/TamA family outer membrane protein [Pseudomonadota bacterium]